MLIHKPTPASFLRAATYDLLWVVRMIPYARRVLERTKIEKLYLVLRCVNLVIAVLEI